MSFASRADMIAKGLTSSYVSAIQDFDTDTELCDEQVAIMALILENCKDSFTGVHVMNFVNTVVSAQRLMPDGKIRSRQTLVTLATIGGLK